MRAGNKKMPQEEYQIIFLLIGEMAYTVFNVLLTVTFLYFSDIVFRHRKEKKECCKKLFQKTLPYINLWINF